MKINRTVKILIVVLLVLQAALSILLWFVNPTGAQSTGTFALLLSADLLAFAMVAHVYRLSTAQKSDSHS